MTIPKDKRNMRPPIRKRLTRLVLVDGPDGIVTGKVRKVSSVSAVEV